MNLKNKIIPCLKGQQYYILGGIPASDNPKQSIYLFDCLGKEPDSSLKDRTADLSLWRVEFCDEKDNASNDMHLWPYEGEDSEYLIKYLLENYLEHALDEKR